MDVLALNTKAGGHAWWAGKGQELGLVVTRQRSQWRFFGIKVGNNRLTEILEVRVSGRRGTVIVKASGKRKNPENSSSGDDDPSIPGSDGLENSDPNGGSKSGDPIIRPKSKFSDWRDFRASLVAQEQVNLLDSDSHTHDSTKSGSTQQLSTKWAHPLPMPEAGCVLVATEKLDGVVSFQRSVVLLLRSGTRDRHEGPFGVIINRPLHKKIKHISPSNPDLASTFSDCPLHFGGPLDSSMFLVKNGEKFPLPGLEQVIPGIRFGARNNLVEAAALVKKGVLQANDFRFFVGYAGWQLDQLNEEIESDYWVVAACSSHLIVGASEKACSTLWEEILQLMGGRYSELSKKPRQDGS